MLSDFIEPQGGRRLSLFVQFLSFNVNARVMKPIEEKKSYKGETQRKLNKSLYLSQKVNVAIYLHSIPRRYQK